MRTCLATMLTFGLLACGGGGGGDSGSPTGPGSPGSPGAPGTPAVPAPIWSGTTFQVPVVFTESAGVGRQDEPVTIGLPVPEAANVLSAASRALADGATPLPVQFTVLSRWGGPPGDATRPVRWVLADLQLSLPANGTRTLTFSNEAGPAPATALTVDLSDPQVLVVQTGAMEVRINRQRGNLIDRVTVGGTVVSQDTSADRSLSGVRLRHGDGQDYRGGSAPAPEVSLEEQWPMRLTVRVATSLSTAGGTVLRPGAVRVVHRLHFYANRTFVRFHTQLENNAPYGSFDGSYDAANAIQFDSLNFDLPLSFGGTRVFRTTGVQETAGAGDTYRVYQGHQIVNANDESQNFFWNVRQNATQIAQGARHEGWVDMRSGTAGVTAAVRWFWQNYEKAFTVTNGRLTIELWTGDGPNHLFEGARRKSHEMLLDFGTGDPAAAAARFSAPVVGRASGLWYYQTEALGMMDPGQVAFAGTHDDARMNAAYARYNVLMRQRAGAAPPDAGRPSPRNVLEAKEQRYRIGTWDTADWYGWNHFGDCAWGDGYSSNHYDMPGFLLIHFLRLGDRALWDLAEPHVRHACEMGQVWGIDPNSYVASLSFYEKSGHGLTPEGNRPAASHNWIRRLVLYYWLTGHRAAYDAALFNAEALRRYFYQGFDISNPASFGFGSGQWSPMVESRFLTWSLENVLEVWALTGDNQWMTMAEDLVRCLLHAFGIAGHLDGEGTRSPGASLMSHYGSEPILRFHRVSSSGPLKAQVLNLLRGMIASTYEADRVAPQGTGPNYRPAAILEDWDGGNPGPEDYNTIFNGFAASLYAYVGWIDGNAGYLAIAHRLWADGVYYPDYYSNYPNRDTRSYANPDSWGWRIGLPPP